MTPSHDLSPGRRTVKQETMVGAIEIAKISRLLVEIAAAIDDPPFTSQQLLVVEQRLEHGFREIGHQGPAASLIARDPNGEVTKAELRRLGERLYRIGRWSDGDARQALTDTLSEIRRRPDEPGGQGLNVIEAAWREIGRRA